MELGIFGTMILIAVITPPYLSYSLPISHRGGRILSHRRFALQNAVFIFGVSVAVEVS